MSRSYPPAAYLVAWDAAGILKAGFSAALRWRAFEARGARLCGLWLFRRSTEAFQAETILDAELYRRWPLAFRTREEAEPYLGGRGGGWKECHRMPPALLNGTAEECVAALRSLMPPVFHERTDVRTYEETTLSP